MSTPPAAHTWEDACAAELGTAQFPGDPEALEILALTYEGLDLTKALQAAFAWAGRLGMAQENLLPLLLDSQARTRTLDHLNRTVMHAARAGSKSPRLRRALVRAYTVLRQPAKAAAEWKALLAIHASEFERELREGPIPDRFCLRNSDWCDLACFLYIHGNLEDIFTTLSAHPLASVDRDTDAAMQLCSLAVQLEQDRTAARCVLPHIVSHDLPEGDARALLAIAAIRLGEFARARLVLADIVKEKPDARTYRHALRACERLEAGAARRPADRCPRDAAIDTFPEAGDAALARVAADTPVSEYAWGYVVRNEDGTVDAPRLFCREGCDRFLDCGGVDNVVATYSVLPEHEPDVLRILPYVDYEVPHVLVQRLREGPVYHGFIEDGGPGIWPWVPACLVPPAREAGPEESPQARGLFAAVLAQLDSGKYEEDSP